VSCKVTLQHQDGDSVDGAVTLQGTLHSSHDLGGPKTPRKLAPAYRAEIELEPITGLVPAPRMIPSELLDLSPPPQGTMSAEAVYNGTTLFHGPHLRGIREVIRADSEVCISRCHKLALASNISGQFPARFDLDPFVADVAFQAALVWVRVLRNVACLPSGGSFEPYRPVPDGQTYYVTLVLDNSKVSDAVWKCRCYQHDENGRLFSRSKLVLTLNKNLTFA